ncbi:unnamed protein product [Clonostachys byssicola]|uniref:Uncharacterized protein n=1 Tax=Clonostachys byssicola TaxID=160290 RepID=A0A9N9XTC2_9HYPO|nr:unnamed protein product [Clonostachys byssicola]
MEYPPYYHDNDVGPFSSVTYSLTPDGPGLHELDLKLRDRDVVLMIEGDDEDKTVRILHLYNVREDTLAEAKTAVDGLLGQVKPLGGGDNTGHTVFRMFDKVFYEINSPVACLLEDADDLESKLEAIDEDDSVHPKRAADTTSELFNPVAELQAACRDFIDRVKPIYSKVEMYSEESCPNRRATILIRVAESVHIDLLIYAHEQSAKGGLVFAWDRGEYPEQRTLMRQPRYYMHFEGQHFDHILQDYPANPNNPRGE